MDCHGEQNFPENFMKLSIQLPALVRVVRLHTMFSVTDPPYNKHLYIRENFIAKLLLKTKPELVKQADNNRRTPLHFASTLGFHELVAMLLELDYSPAYSFDIDGSAPIHMSVHFGRIRVIKELLRYCPDLKDLVDRKGQNILHMAVECQQVGVIRYILQEKKLESLINGIDKDGNTPLHCASIKSYPYMVNLLVRDKRVDVSTLNRKRWTALDIARMQSYESKEDHQVCSTVSLI
ncbi:hypothetical protein IFM89_025237 [Coptis chinensis]|uniref:Uncharacterized protein n=1 Tax=Coptis chinensis TaxID=261450 RepID=A0A835GZ93_9MAGN|nr:hypothetical protein IFM89_025237 [Coptis chinensis]